MRRKTGLTIVEQAILLVPEFNAGALKPEYQAELRGQSARTQNNYIRGIAWYVIHFEKHLLCRYVFNCQLLGYEYSGDTAPHPTIMST